MITFIFCSDYPQNKVFQIVKQSKIKKRYTMNSFLFRIILAKFANLIFKQSFTVFA